MKVRDPVKLIEGDGWRQVRMRDRHRQYKHQARKGLVTIPGHPSDDVHPDTLKSVLLQADLRKKS